VRDASLEFDDRRLGSRAGLAEVDGELRIGPDGASCELSASLDAPGAESGPKALNAVISASGWETPLAELELDGRIEIAALDLAPYAPLLREYARFSPPEGQISGALEGRAARGELELKLELAAAAVGVARARGELPLEATSALASARVNVPCEVDVAAALGLFRDRLEIPEGGHVAGRVKGTIDVRAPCSLADVFRDGWAALEGLVFEYRAASDDFSLRMPLGPDHPALRSGASGDGATGCQVSIAGRLTGFTGSYRVPPRFIRVSGELELAGDFLWGDARADGIATRFEVTGGKLAFADTRAMLNGGQLRSRQAVLDLDSKPPEYELDVGVDGVGASSALASLLAYVLPFLEREGERDELSGVIDAELHLAGKGFEPVEAERHLIGEGSVRVRRGSLNGSARLREVAGVFGQHLERIPFEEIFASFRIAEGQVRSEYSVKE
jgi:hypothetical protein